jgi:hypothetical protein
MSDMKIIVIDLGSEEEHNEGVFFTCGRSIEISKDLIRIDDNDCVYYKTPFDRVPDK